MNKAIKLLSILIVTAFTLFGLTDEEILNMLDEGELKEVGSVSLADGITFNKGETITYDIRGTVEGPLPFSLRTDTLGSLKVTMVDVEVMRNRPVYYCTAEAYTVGIVNNIYDFRENYYSYFDAKTFQTYQTGKIAYNRQMLPQKRAAWQDVVSNVFYPEDGTIMYYSEKKSPNGIEGKILEKTYDLFTLIYYMRAVDKSKGVTIRWVAHYKGGEGEAKLVFSPGPKVKIPINRKLVPVNTVRAEDRETGIVVFLAKDYDYLPIEGTLPAFKVGDFEIKARLVFRTYQKGEEVTIK